MGSMLRRVSCQLLLEQLGIVDHAGHQLAGLLVLVEAERQALQVLVDVGTDVGDDVPAGDVGHVASEKAQNPTGHIDCQRYQGQPRDVTDRVWSCGRIGDLGDHAPYQLRNVQLHRHQQEHAHYGDAQGLDIAPGKSKGKDERLHDLFLR